MKHYKLLILLISLSFFSSIHAFAETTAEGLFSTPESKEQFAREVSFLIEKAWKKWQDAVRVNDIYVDGSQGILSAGDLKGPALTVSSVMSGLDRKGKPQDYIGCVRAVASSVENGMRLWQRGYTHNNIPFPRGASCTITLPPTDNVPVTVESGSSSGDNAMKQKALYNYMLYRAPGQGKDVLIVFRAAAKTISECFSTWKDSCSISGIVASGGIAPQPAPMGPGPGLVRGAKGSGGKLTGAYFDGDLMYKKMMKYFKGGA
jgi:hypothetical protein